MASGAVLTAVVEQPPPGVLPYRVRAVEPDRVGSLDLDDAVAATA